MPTPTRTKIEAQDRVLTQLVELAASAAKEGRTDLADAITDIAKSLAKKWGVSDAPGLPATKAGT